MKQSEFLNRGVIAHKILVFAISLIYNQEPHTNSLIGGPGKSFRLKIKSVSSKFNLKHHKKSLAMHFSSRSSFTAAFESLPLILYIPSTKLVSCNLLQIVVLTRIYSISAQPGNNPLFSEARSEGEISEK